MSLSPEQSPQTRNSPPLDHGEGAPFSNGTKNQGNISFLLTPRQSEQAFFFARSWPVNAHLTLIMEKEMSGYFSKP